jgi:hypothetical protein
MAIVCIPREEANKIKQGIKNGDINIENMFGMTSEQRFSMFRKYVDESMAKFLNVNFERAMISNKKTAMIDFAYKLGGKMDISKDDITKQIDEVGDILNNTDSIEKIEDIISQKIGIKVTQEEFDKLNKYSEELKSLRFDEKGEEVLDKYGNPNNEYFVKRNEMEEYMQSLSPDKKIAVAIGVIGRGNMLFNVAPIALNIESNTLMGLTGAFERRITRGYIRGLNIDQIIPYAKYIVKMYAKTGYDLSSMQDLRSDFVVRGEKITHTEGKGITRWIGRQYKKFIFQWAQGVPDIFSQALTFADVANMESSKIAKKEGLRGKEAKARALEIMKDSFAVYPKTEDGMTVREAARAEALYRTWKNQSVYAEAGLGARDFISKITGKMGVGEGLIPFIKTPANVAGAGIDYSGGLGIRGVLQVVEAIRNRRYFGSKENLQRAGVYFARQGLALLFVALLASMFDDDDYMPDYLSATADERKFAKQYNIPFNSVKIGNKWVSFDYVGAYGAPLKAWLHARKYGKGGSDTFKKYGLAVGQQLISFPGFNNLMKLGDDLKNNLTSTSKQDQLEEIVAKFGIDFVSSRFIPSILGNMAAGLDQYERETKTLLGGIQSKIPGLRFSLKEKINVFGDPIKTQPFLSNVFFGARVKQIVEGNPVYDELERLLEQGELPTLSEVQKNSDRVKLMKEKLGEEEFNEMLDKFYSKYKEESADLIDSRKYEKATDEEKKELWNSLMNDILTDTVNKYHYKRIKREKDREEDK